MELRGLAHDMGAISLVFDFVKVVAINRNILAISYHIENNILAIILKMGNINERLWSTHVAMPKITIFQSGDINYKWPYFGYSYH